MMKKERAPLLRKLQPMKTVIHPWKSSSFRAVFVFFFDEILFVAKWGSSIKRTCGKNGDHLCGDLATSGYKTIYEVQTLIIPLFFY
jgi:hypothetical protein